MIYDLSDLVNHANFSSRVNGIQRVVQEGLHALSSHNSLRYLVISFASHKAFEVFPDSGGFKSSDLTDFKLMDVFCDLHNASATKTRLSEFFSRRFGKTFGFVFDGVLNLPLACNLLGFLARTILKNRNPHLSKLRVEQFAEIASGEQVFLMGGLWNDLEGYKQFFGNQGKNAHLTVFVHDIIPLRISQVPESLTTLFKEYVPMVFKNASSIVTSTAFNKSEMESWAASASVRVPKISVINLAHTFPVVEDSAICTEVRALQGERYALCVGSVEPRKNHLNLLLIWNKFQQSTEYGFEKLVIAGHWGWGTEAIRQTLLHTGHFSGSVVFIEKPSDSELDYLYNNSLFTIYPSFYEGWGLPVGEALSKGKPVLAFNTSSIPEVAQGVATLIDPFDYQEMLSAIKSHFKSDALSVAANSVKWRNWQDFGSDLVELVNDQIS